jgi:hypothetical protein
MTGQAWALDHPSTQRSLLNVTSSQTLKKSAYLYTLCNAQYIKSFRPGSLVSITAKICLLQAVPGWPTFPGCAASRPAAP